MFNPDELPGWAVASLCGAMVAVGFFLPVIVACFEKRLIWPYGRIAEGDPRAPPAQPYHRGVAREAEALGFSPLGIFQDRRGRLYRVRYEFWLSRERDVLAMVGAGALGAVPVQSTWLYTALADGRVAVSTDHQAAMEPAPGDPWEWKLLIHASPGELLARHRDRVQGMFASVAPFDAAPSRVLHQMQAIRRDRVAGFVDRGLARYRDEDRSAWSYSFLGSLRLVARMYRKGFYDALTQPSRSIRSRPGDARFRGTALAQLLHRRASFPRSQRGRSGMMVLASPPGRPTNQGADP